MRTAGGPPLDRPPPDRPRKATDDDPMIVRPSHRARNLRMLVAAVAFGYILYSGYMFTQQKRLIADQDRVARSIAERLVPLLDRTRPLVDDFERTRPRAEQRLADAAALVRETRPLVREARPLARETLPVVRAAAPVLADLNALDLRSILAATGDAARQAAAGDRTARSLDATIDLLAELRRRDLPRRLAGLAERAERDLPALVALQREALALQRQTLVIQTEALARIRSIDQKTGGTPPPALTGPPTAR